MANGQSTTEKLIHDVATAKTEIKDLDKRVSHVEKTVQDFEKEIPHRCYRQADFDALYDRTRAIEEGFKFMQESRKTEKAWRIALVSFFLTALMSIIGGVYSLGNMAASINMSENRRKEDITTIRNDIRELRRELTARDIEHYRGTQWRQN